MDYSDPLDALNETSKFRRFFDNIGFTKPDTDVQTKEQIEDTVVRSPLGKAYIKADPKTRFDFLKLVARHDTEKYINAYKEAINEAPEELEFVDGPGGIKRSEIAKAYNQASGTLQSDFLKLVAKVNPDHFSYVITAARADVEAEMGKK